MDVVSLGFILLMVLVGGLVAYIADNLGRKLGKKRLTIGKLRPRHTATLMTVAAGMLIPLVTVIAVATLSSDVRVWIAEGRRAVAERDKALGERDTARREVAGLQTEQDKLRKSNSDLRGELAQRREDLKTIRGTVEDLQNSLSSLRSQLANVQAGLKSANQQLQNAIEQVADAQQERDKVSGDLLALQSNLKDLEARNVTLDRLKRESELYQASLSEDISELEDQLKQLEGERGDLSNQVQQTSAELSRSKSDLEREKLNLDEARGQITVAQKQLQDLQAGIMALSEILGDSRTKPLMFSIGQEVARVAVPQGVNEDGARAYLQAVLKRAADIAEQQGAQPLRGPTAAGLVERQDDDRQTVSVEEQMDRLTESIQKESSEVLLVASSLVNSFKGEFVGLDVRVYRNPLVYRYTEVVAQGWINGNESEISIYNQLVNFLQTDIRDSAIRKGMIPVAGPEQSLGEVSSEDMFRLMREIKTFGKQVRLVAMAEAETRAGDPLKLFFRVR